MNSSGHATFAELGLDSLVLMELLVRLEEVVGDELADRLTRLSSTSTLGEASVVLLGPTVLSADG
ncbi:phosphopantetheine-binding protein [Streptomyces subrutilus]|uniref:phosphopantetheine-binding protein n=1 Tax=Streptomyces subrutilus TaxID=36818 RepID=UPI0034076F91